jgi:hypothetical protein
VLRRAATALLVAAFPATLGPPAATANPGWGKPFRLTAPYATDLTAVNLALSPRGDAAGAFSVQDEDSPAVSDPFLVIRAAGGGVSAPFAVSGAQLVLDLAYDRSGLRLLTGTSESGKACCSNVQTLSLLRDGRFGRASTIVGQLAGATVGSLTPLPSGRLLATVATDHGVWVAQSSPGGGFGATRRLTAAAAMPWTTAATADARGQTAVAWTETKGQQGELAPDKIYIANGSERAVPGRPHPAFTVPAGHQIDEIGLAPSADGVTAAWIESWFDMRGAYRAQVVVSDLSAGSTRRVFSVGGQTASGLALAGDARGDQIVAWRSCVASGSCTARAAVRTAGRPYGGSQWLGAIDPGQSPAAAISPSGDGLVGWIGAGHVVAAERRPGARGLGAARTVSATSYASGLALAFGSSRNAVAAWTQGTLSPDVVGAVFRGS